MARQFGIINLIAIWYTKIMAKKFNPEFNNLPLGKLADIALSEAKKLKASYADFRLERLQNQLIRIKDLDLEGVNDTVEIGYGVRVIYDGSWGFAASNDLAEANVRSIVKQAVTIAQQFRSLNQEPVELADEPIYTDEYISDYSINPFEVETSDKVEYLKAINKQVFDSKKVDHVDSFLNQVLENKFFASGAGSRIKQQRIRLYANFEALKIDKTTGVFETMRSNAVPTGQGWEYIKEYDFFKDAIEIPKLLSDKLKAPSVEPGKYDLVIEPSNLFLTIHESVGHATELDRVLGYEANFAGTSFATLDKLNKLQYGSKIMHITGDRVVKNGLSTIKYDDEGVKTGQWDLIRGGVLVGYQLNRQMAKRQEFGRSNGCAYADSFNHVPLQRMSNVSLQPNSVEKSTTDLIKKVQKGIYIVGDKSWSIDMQRFNFQFTGQQFWEIVNGKVVGQLKDVAYQAKTTDFWNSMEDIGGPKTFLLAGAFNCGKGQPAQIAPVSHGAPSALFRSVNILNTANGA